MKILFISPVYAQLKEWKDVGGETKGVANFKALEAIFSNILTISVSLAGIAVFIMLIVGAFGYLTSSGNPEKIKKATSILTGAIIGLVVLISIWFILKFVEQFTGVTVTKFEVPGT